MAASIIRNKQAEDVWGHTRIQVITLTADSSYPSTGYPIYAAPLGFKQITGAQVQGISGTLANSGGLIPVIDLKTLAQTSGVTLRFFYPTGGATAPASLAAPVGSIPSGSTAVESTSAQPAVALEAGLGKEVAADTDLSTVTVTLLLMGA